MKLLPLRYYLLTLSITFFYNIILPFVADARYACQYVPTARADEFSCREYPGCCPGSCHIDHRCSIRFSVLGIVHRCTAVIMTNFCLSPSKFILDKFNGYSQQEAANVAGAIYISALVFTTVAGFLIVRIQTCFPLWIIMRGGAHL